jgi:hypothetical protein
VKGIFGGVGEEGEAIYGSQVQMENVHSFTEGLGLNEHGTSFSSLPYSTTSNEGL